MLVWHLAQPRAVLTPCDHSLLPFEAVAREMCFGMVFPAIFKTNHGAGGPAGCQGRLCSDTSVVCEQLRPQSQYFSCANQQAAQLRQRGLVWFCEQQWLGGMGNFSFKQNSKMGKRRIWDSKILFLIKTNKDHFSVLLKTAHVSWTCGFSWEVGKGDRKNLNLLYTGLSF